VIAEIEGLAKNIEHIKDIVAMQQSYAKTSGFIETVPLADLVEDALRMNVSSLVRHDVELVQSHQPVRNAKFGLRRCRPHRQADRRADTRATRSGGAFRGRQRCRHPRRKPHAHLQPRVHHAQSGPWFRPHSGALAARQLGGSLTVQSVGPGCGAIFILELP